MNDELKEKMKQCRSEFSNKEFSPDIELLPDFMDVFCYIKDYKKNHGGKLTFLDVGGRRGEYAHCGDGFEYKILEIDKNSQGTHVIHGDICHCSNIQDEIYDIVFSIDVFEHVKEPWLAAEECVRLTKKGGLNIHVTLFAWRYHPVPVDMFRYTHKGLRFLFERTGKIKTLLSVYDISRRRNNLGLRGKVPGDLDAAPVDDMGGFRENWRVVFVGEKI